ncbi:hypothetical protein G3N57_00770 [Paraburkholderia sp. Se-20369]|nr:hypothetical protein [Paraburkholderia sp. Se-20369]
MNTNKTQLRGNCQCCLRDQAVLDTGRMSKHGYTVKGGPGFGWFSGVCSGQHHRPLQKDRSHLDAIVVVIREEAAALKIRAEGLIAGTIRPLTARMSSRPVDREGVPFDQAPKHMQKQAIQIAIANAESRSRNGYKLADQMVEFAGKVHGTELREVPVDAGPAPIKLGEKRVAAGGRVVEAVELRGARVYWRDSKGFKSWTGAQAWRRFANAD